MWFPSSEVATLGWMVSLCKSVSSACCGSAEQSSGKAETPWFFASMGFRKRLAVTVSHIQVEPFIYNICFQDTQRDGLQGTLGQLNSGLWGESRPNEFCIEWPFVGMSCFPALMVLYYLPFLLQGILVSAEHGIWFL